MTERMREPEPARLQCPTCGEHLRHEDDLLRCAQHGLFFTYGPSLLVAVPNSRVAEPALMPWQTLNAES